MKLSLSEAMPMMAVTAAVVLVAAVACGGDGDQERAAQVPSTTESGAPANESGTAEIETAARKLLSDELEVDEADFRLESSEGVGWPDASMGCPQEGMAYAQVTTPGHKLFFDLAGTSHAVHANSDGSHMVICGEGR